MFAPADNAYRVSKSPHSIGLQNNLTVPSAWGDTNPLIQGEKDALTAGLQGKGLSGLTFDGTGFLGTGLFSGDVSTWGIPEIAASAIGVYAVYSMIHQTKQTKYRLEASAGRRRKSKAGKLRERAKRLEDRTTGIF